MWKEGRAHHMVSAVFVMLLAAMVGVGICAPHEAGTSNVVSAAKVDEAYKRWMSEASKIFEEYLALREQRIREWSKTGGGANWDTSGDDDTRREEQDGDSSSSSAVMDVESDESASSYFEEVVSGGRMSREQMMMEHILRHYNESRALEVKKLAERSEIHAEHVRQALREEGARLAAEGLLTKRRARAQSTSPFKKALDVALDFGAVVVLIVLPWRMILALLEQRRTGARRPPPLFAKRD